MDLCSAFIILVTIVSDLNGDVSIQTNSITKKLHERRWKKSVNHPEFSHLQKFYDIVNLENKKKYKEDSKYDFTSQNSDQRRFRDNEITDDLFEGKAVGKKNRLSGEDYYPSEKQSKQDSVEDVEEPRLTIINQFLHPERKPFVNLTITSSKILYRFEVSPETTVDNYMISVTVEKMYCKVGGNNSARLYIGGEMSETYLCKEINNQLNNFQSVDHITDGDHFVNISGIGNWKDYGFSATLVASIYFETSRFKYCEERDHFSCGTKDMACRRPTSRPSSTVKTMNLAEVPLHLYPHYARSAEMPGAFRCIPKHDFNGESLLCNGHPNCGFHCNADEQKGNCPRKDEDGEDECPGYTCREYQQDRFLVTILLLVIFCIFIPLSIFLIICNRKDLQRDFQGRGRCPVPLEVACCPFSMNPEETPEQNSNQNVANATRTRNHDGHRRNGRRAPRGGTRRSEEVNSVVTPRVNYARGEGMENFSFLDDLPPSYTECINNKEMYPALPPNAAPGNGIAVISGPSLAPLVQETSFGSEGVAPPQTSISFQNGEIRNVCQCNRHRRSNLPDEIRNGT